MTEDQAKHVYYYAISKMRGMQMEFEAVLQKAKAGDEAAKEEIFKRFLKFATCDS